jgi:hypothetical protein
MGPSWRMPVSFCRSPGSGSHPPPSSLGSPSTAHAWARPPPCPTSCSPCLRAAPTACHAIPGRGTPDAWRKVAPTTRLPHSVAPTHNACMMGFLLLWDLVLRVGTQREAGWREGQGILRQQTHPSPSSRPHAYNWPSLVSASVCAPPHATLPHLSSVAFAGRSRMASSVPPPIAAIELAAADAAGSNKVGTSLFLYLHRVRHDAIPHG